jgi:hypothetical protein
MPRVGTCTKNKDNSLLGQGGKRETLPGLLLDAHRKAHTKNVSSGADRLAVSPSMWREELYLEALAASQLKKPVQKTLVAMLESAGGGETTTIDRSTLCSITGVRREATISGHWRLARQHGLLWSSARFNRSSVHRFTLPGSGLPEADWLSGSILTPLRVHRWLPHEREWWETVGSEAASIPPWGDGTPPF